MNKEIIEVFTFILELEKLKQVFRQNKPIGLNRYENSAEHCWQVSLLALSLEKYATTPININRVIKMLLLHDVVEIDAGDVMVYDDSAREAIKEKEQQAANRIFGMLPDHIRDEYLTIWNEFEDEETPEAQYAAAMDRLMPVLQNVNNSGQTWVDHSVPEEVVLKKNSKIAKGSAETWEIIEQKIIETFAEMKKEEN